MTGPALQGSGRASKRESITDAVLRMRLVGASSNARMTGIGELPGKSNYFIGNDPKKWSTEVPNYARVRYQSVYPGIDLVYYGNQGQLEYDFIVASGADPTAIALDVGATRELPRRGRAARTPAPLRIDANGDLVVGLEGYQVRFHKPAVYQPLAGPEGPRESAPARRYVEGRYVLKGQGQVSFAVADYDKTKPLVIDPVLVYSSLVGGSAEEQAFAIAVDGSGNAYLTGFTQSTDFPRVNQISGACNGRCGSASHIDTFVTKINATGAALVYSTRIGGSGNQYGNGIAVDGPGNVYLIGDSTSTDFPIVNQIPGACQGSCGRGTNYDVYALKINAAGNTLVYSSYIGGSSLDEGYGIAIDGSGNAYLGGFTTSSDFPRVNQIPGACQGTCGTGQSGGDAFVAKISSNGPEVGLSPASLNFGPQGIHAPNIPQVATLTNTGGAPLTISSIAVTGQNSGDFLEADNCPRSPSSLAPGDSCQITVIFVPTGTGTRTAAVTVSDNAPGSPQNVPLSGIGAGGKPGME